jgi:hypothetical protein
MYTTVNFERGQPTLQKYIFGSAISLSSVWRARLRVAAAIRILSQARLHSRIASYALTEYTASRQRLALMDEELVICICMGPAIYVYM